VKRTLSDYLDTLDDTDTVGRQYLAEAIYVARRDDVLDEPTPDDLKPIIRDLPETLTADQALVWLACERLATDDGRDKGMGALADELDVTLDAVRRWRLGMDHEDGREPSGPAARLVRQVLDAPDGA
jgi:hypothetical protein